MTSNRSRASLIATLALATIACQGGPPPREAQLEALSEDVAALEVVLEEAYGPTSDGLHFGLAFGADADLDLFVTGPQQESVYFANTPSAIGGELAEDLRCDASSPRVEVVRYADAPVGRYRVSIDFPRRCDGRGDDRDAAVPYAVRVWRDGDLIDGARGVIRLGEFLSIVLEVDVR